VTSDLHRWLGTLPLADWPKRREGKFLRFLPMHERVMSRPVYNVVTVRGEAFSIGRIEYRNQWGAFSFTADAGVPINREIIAEIYAMLKELDSR